MITSRHAKTSCSVCGGTGLIKNAAWLCDIHGANHYFDDCYCVIHGRAMDKKESENFPNLEEEMEAIDQAMSISLFHKPYTELMLRILEKDFVDKVWFRAMQCKQFNDHGAGI